MGGTLCGGNAHTPPCKPMQTCNPKIFFPEGYCLPPAHPVPITPLILRCQCRKHLGWWRRKCVPAPIPLALLHTFSMHNWVPWGL